MTTFLSTLLGSVLSASALISTPQNALVRIEPEMWISNPGTQFLVDTKDGFGYLVNPYKLTYTVFPVATGKEGTVCHQYLGCYNGTTPEADWVIRGDIETKGHWYFRTKENKPGRFFRFYKVLGDGTEERTPYGLHTFHTVEEELKEGRNKWSYGCVVAPDTMLDLIQSAYEKNGGMLPVKTRYGNPFEILVAEARS